MKSRTSLIIVILLVFNTLFRCGRNEPSAMPPQAVPVELSKVRYEGVSIPITTSGLLFSKEQIRLSFKTGGVVASINISEGQTVDEGQALAQLVPDEIEARVRQAESGFEKAKRDYLRVKRLYADSVVTLEQMQNIETAFEIAKANVEMARFNQRYSVIKAPSDGKILKQFVHEGEIVGPGTPVFYFGSGRREWVVRIGLSEVDVVNVNLGDAAEATFDAYPNIIFKGRVTEIATAADPKSGLFEVEISLRSGRRLADGFVARVSIFPRKEKKQFLIPVDALSYADGHEAAVFTVAADTAVKLPVTVGPIIGNDIVVLSGLQGVEQVVTAGASYLKVGDRVTIQ